MTPSSSESHLEMLSSTGAINSSAAGHRNPQFTVDRALSEELSPWASKCRGRFSGMRTSHNFSIAPPTCPYAVIYP
jgi:hypothetical protein